MAGSAQTVMIGGHRLRLTNPDKVLYPESGTTKAEVLQYLLEVAPVMLPHLADRLCTRKRWPEGVGKPGQPGEVFFEKNLPDHAPDWMRRVRVEHTHQAPNYPVVESVADLAWLGQMNALELHVHQWKVDEDGTPVNPDRLVLDLDPGPGAGLAECAAVAHEARELLQDVGLETFPVTSGSKGLHLYAHLDGDLDADYVNGFAKQLAKALESQLPDLVVSSMTKSIRKGKVLVDWSQNNASKTTVAPYSLRGTYLPMVAAPRYWDEIDDDLEHLDFHQVLDRLDDDPLAALPDGEAPADPPEPERSAPAKPKAAATQAPAARDVPKAKRPRDIDLMLASAASSESAAVDPETWAYEMKWDGVRALAVVDDGAVSLYSRNGNDLTGSYPEVVEALADADLGTVTLDGELVAFDDDGAPDFGLLQHRMGVTKPSDVRSVRGRIPVHYLAFDLLEHDGSSLRSATYEQRREALEYFDIGDDTESTLRVPAGFDGDLDEAIAASLDNGLEGVMAKRRASQYRAGRSKSWLKLKNIQTQDVVVIGWSPGSGGRKGSIGSLILGVHRDGELSYAGRVGSGFSQAQLDALSKLLPKLETDSAPLSPVPAEVSKDAHWVEPTLVAEVTFTGWTHSGHVRHATWRGLRDDVPVEDVTAN